MQRIDSSTSVATLPTPSPTNTPGYFSKPVLANGFIGTQVTQDWLNSVQEEIVSVIVAGGVSLSKSLFNNLLTAIQNLIRNFVGNGLTPIGSIMMFSGSVAPVGWAFCDGQTVNGITTPNLQDKFIVGAGNLYATSTTGGQASYMAMSSLAGGTSQTLTGATTLTAAQVPSLPVYNSLANPPAAWITVGVPTTQPLDSGWAPYPATGQAGAPEMQTSALGNGNIPQAIGGGGSHVHTIYPTPAHYHDTLINTLPPFYALSFIIRVS